jgi:hypothetical protein
MQRRRVVKVKRKSKPDAQPGTSPSPKPVAGHQSQRTKNLINLFGGFRFDSPPTPTNHTSPQTNAAFVDEMWDMIKLKREFSDTEICTFRRANFKQESVPPNGSCLFHSMKRMAEVHGISKRPNAAAIRKQAVAGVREHWNSLRRKNLIDQYEEKEAYCLDMGHPRTWGTGAEIEVMSRVWGRPIVVFIDHRLPTGRRMCSVQAHGLNRKAELIRAVFLHLENDHFTPLIRRSLLSS